MARIKCSQTGRVIRSADAQVWVLRRCKHMKPVAEAFRTPACGACIPSRQYVIVLPACAPPKVKPVFKPVCFPKPKAATANSSMLQNTAVPCETSVAATKEHSVKDPKKSRVTKVVAGSPADAGAAVKRCTKKHAATPPKVKSAVTPPKVKFAASKGQQTPACSPQRQRVRPVRPSDLCRVDTCKSFRAVQENSNGSRLQRHRHFCDFHAAAAKNRRELPVNGKAVRYCSRGRHCVDPRLIGEKTSSCFSCAMERKLSQQASRYARSTKAFKEGNTKTLS